MAKSGAKLLPVAALGVLVAVGVQVMPACSSSRPATATTTTTTTPTSTTGDSSCDHPSPGCACSSSGQVAPCGKVISSHDGFVECSIGTITCDGVSWGSCQGDIKVTTSAISGGGISIEGLGTPTACGTSNPCDPFCYKTVDTPTGVDAGLTEAGSARFYVNPDSGGMQLPMPTGINICAEAQNESTDYTSSFPAAFKPSGCTSGVSDNCPADTYCVSNVCTPYTDGVVNPKAYPQGDAGTYTTCGLEPDFTVGLGCWDSATHPWELEVCNRGGITANSGTLQVALQSGTPTGTVGTCGFPTGPQVSANNATSGVCGINLTTSPLNPGECRSFNIAATCTQTNSSTPLTALTGTVFAVVNPPSTFLAGATPLVECDSCNNYTAINMASTPSTSQCTQTWCGYQTGGSASACNTTISGTVMDPGQNVGLSNIEVYVPTQAPISFTDPSGQSNYQCDTCASLNTPFSTSEAVATDVHGNFSIRLPSFGAGVNNLPYLIIQTGRWRRVVKNTAITGCTNNTLPIASTALPANSSQGDIPKIALVTADQESAECFLRKVGISASEISAHSGSGDTTRITLYRDNGVGQTTTATIPQYSTTLLNSSSPTLWNYSVVMWPCDGSNPGSSSPGTDANGFQPSSAQLNMMLNFANAGGRFFMDHYAGQMWAAVGPSAWQGLGGWDDNGDSPNGYPAQGKILNGSSSSDQQAFFQWASTWDVNVGNSYGAGYIQSAVPREVLLTPSSAFLTMVEGESNNNWSGDPNGNYVLSGWYNTPVTASAGSYCGRVVFNDMHVSSARAACSQPCSYYWPYGWSCWTDCSENASFNPSVFPTFCQSTSLTSEELALEYQFFEVSACNLGVSLPVPPPPIPAPPPALVPTTFTRTFQAGCLPGYSPKWGPFQWQANIPTGTSISFTAQTAPDATGGGAGTYGTAVPIGTASTSTSGWTPLPPSCPVAGHLGDWANAGAAAAAGVAVDPTCTGSLPAQTSQDWLQVSITFNPSTTQTPTLLEWQQLFDCVP